MDREDVMEKVAKLLSLAADERAPQGERDTAQSMANKLMLKYNISVLEATSKEEIEEQGAARAHAEMFHGGKTDWEVALANGIARSFHSRMVIHSRYRGPGFFTFIGMADDLEMVRYFFDYLQIEVDNTIEDTCGYGSTKKVKNAFGLGMAHRLGRRLTDLYKYVDNNLPSDCRDLVVVKDAVVKKTFDKLFPKLGTHKSWDVDEEMSHYFQGQIAGDQVDLASPRDQVEDN